MPTPHKWNDPEYRARLREFAEPSFSRERPCGHDLAYHYYGGAMGYRHCDECDRWWQTDLNGWRSPEHMKEVGQPYTVDLLTDFARG